MVSCDERCVDSNGLVEVGDSVGVFPELKPDGASAGKIISICLAAYGLIKVTQCEIQICNGAQGDRSM
ncbi:hypothetical protein I41_01490 [Lacipirellula limnantheis]|uniref:Uncharacterized protein n=1 Tax=Lacipirellula limnantheis TaxID=2528024 RepID=A0A517TRJ5_9BACT|nr:hypothetical protein I41_01490 [Lacipirellula limnantheis]